MSVAAYKKTMRETSSPREIEKKVLSQVTGRLERVGSDYDVSEGGIQALTLEIREAIQDNQKLWMALKSDLMAVGNEYPKETKAGLISIAIWVDSHSWKVMKGEAKIAPLVDVNKSIIDGLSGRSPA